MKVLFIHNRYRQSGGEDVAVAQEADLLAQQGHEVRVMYFDNKEIQGFFPKLFAALRAVYNFSSGKRLDEVIRNFKPEIIHVHNLFFIASPSVLYTAARYKTPVVATLHNYRLICANALLLRNGNICELCVHKMIPLQGIRYRCYRDSKAESAAVTAITAVHKLFNTWKKKVSVYITLNEFSKNKFLHSSLELSGQKMITKPNFVQDPGAGHYPREDFFLFAGRIVKEKGVRVLLQAFEKLPEHKIVLAGEGPEKDLLKQKFSHAGNIVFTGHLDKPALYDLMKRCRAFICPSIWYEGSPLTIIEAFANGTPVIASRLGSMTESITDGYNGFHFTSGDVNDLQDKVKRLFNETAQSQELYVNARRSYLEKYHPDIHYRDIMAIYQSVLNPTHA